MGYSNNSGYFGDWFGKGQVDFSKVINPSDAGDLHEVKMWSGCGYILDVYLVNAGNACDAIDKVFEWSYENEGKNKLVFDYDYLQEECRRYFEAEPDLLGDSCKDSYEDFEARFFEDYVSNDDYTLFTREENFFVGKVPEEVLAKAIA